MRTLRRRLPFSLPYIAAWLAFVLALVVILGAARTKAQSPAPSCRVKVRIANYNWNGSGELSFDRMTANQTEWWLKEGQKKFPGVCLVTESGVADYVIAWAATVEERSSTYTVPRVESTTEHRGTVNGTATSSTDLGVVNSRGTYSGSSTTTSYEQKQFEYSIGYVNAFVHRTTPEGEKRRIEKLPVFVAQHKGQWKWSKPDKDAFEKAIKFISKQSQSK